MNFYKTWRYYALRTITRYSEAQYDEDAARLLYKIFDRLSDAGKVKLYNLIVRDRRALYDALNVVNR